jgi:hypothetical protein
MTPHKRMTPHKLVTPRGPMICGTFEPATAVPHQPEILNAFWSIEAHVPESRAKSPPLLDEIPTLLWTWLPQNVARIVRSVCRKHRYGLTRHYDERLARRRRQRTTPRPR